MLFTCREVEEIYIEVQFVSSTGEKKSVFIEAEGSDLVSQVKEKALLELEEGLLGDNYELYFEDTMLDNNSYFFDCRIQDFETLVLRHKSADVSSNISPGMTVTHEGQVYEEPMGGKDNEDTMLKLVKGLMKHVNYIGLCCLQRGDVENDNL